MKIMVSHIQNTFNFGSAMMAINLIYYLNKKLCGNVQFFVDTRTEEDLNNLIKSTGLKNIKINEILPYNTKLIKGKKDVNLDIDWINEYCDGIIKNYDYFIVLGGDDLSEYYSKLHIAYELYKINKIAKHIPTFLVGQTIGPFTGWRKKYASEKLKQCNIFTRDCLTYKYLRNDLKVQSVTKSSDLAFLDLPKQNDYNLEKCILKKFNLKKDDYIAIIPSGLTNLYTDDYNSYINNWISIIQYLLNEKDYKVVLLSHVTRPKDVDDNLVIKNIINKLDNKYLCNLNYIDKKMMLPLEARFILGNSVFSVSGRMHGAVSTFQMGKPSISLSYSVKYKGVIGDDLDCKDLIVESSNELWINNRIEEIVKDKIEYLIDNYSSIVNKIKQNVNICKEEVFNSIDEIYNYIKEDRDDKVSSKDNK